MKISLLIPTRKRPHYLERLFKSIVATADNINEIEACLYIDNDDNETINKLDELSKIMNVYDIIGPRIRLSQTWNECYDGSDWDSEIIWHGNDDCEFVTKGWDTLVIKAFDQYNDKIVFVGGRNSWTPHDGDLFTHGWLHKNWINTLGYTTPDYFSSDFCDLWLTEVAKKIGRFHYIPELLIPHYHPAYGTAPEDQTHKDRIIRHYADNVKQKYDDLASKREEDANKLRKFINDYPRIKALEELTKQGQDLGMGY